MGLNLIRAEQHDDEAIRRLRQDASDRRARVDAYAVDRRVALRNAVHLRPSPPYAQSVEQQLKLRRDRDTWTRLDAMRAILKAPARTPVPFRTEGSK